MLANLGRAMKQRPILMPPPMVEALRREVNPKTVTRRTKGLELINEMPDKWRLVGFDSGSNTWIFGQIDRPIQVEIKCPYGVVGDQLWVKETYYALGGWRQQYSEKKGRDEWHFVDITQTSNLAYKYADNPPATIEAGRDIKTVGWYKRSSLFMSYTAGRMTLEITGIRCERLQEIDTDDVLAEGVAPCLDCDQYNDLHRQGIRHGHPADYQELWNSINGPNSWDRNEWVWPVTFKQI